MFAQQKVTLPKGRHKIIILDEADSMTDGAQQALRRTMEIYSKTTRFALACNASDKIIEPIQSRCAVLRYTKLTDAQVLARLMSVLEKEEVRYTDDGLEAIIFTAQGDMRQALNNLQSTFSGFGFINSENVFKVCDEPHPLLVKEMIQHCVHGDIDEAYKDSLSRPSTRSGACLGLGSLVGRWSTNWGLRCAPWLGLRSLRICGRRAAHLGFAPRHKGSGCLQALVCVQEAGGRDSQILAHLWHLGYSPEDVIGNIFRVCKTFQMAEYLKLEFIKVGQRAEMPQRCAQRSSFFVVSGLMSQRCLLCPLTRNFQNVMQMGSCRAFSQVWLLHSASPARDTWVAVDKATWRVCRVDAMLSCLLDRPRVQLRVQWDTGNWIHAHESHRRRELPPADGGAPGQAVSEDNSPCGQLVHPGCSLKRPCPCNAGVSTFRRGDAPRWRWASD
ncbi:replication factor C subunit 2 isoform X4 [Marmota marmota marmota]|nr:replication factor C subunit 2 isoform X4 [Marmota marmota marmota]